MTVKQLRKILRLVPRNSRIVINGQDIEVELKQDQDDKWCINIIIPSSKPSPTNTCGKNSIPEERQVSIPSALDGPLRGLG